MSILASRLGSFAPCPEIGLHVGVAQVRPQLRTSSLLCICFSKLPEAIHPFYIQHYTISAL